MAAEPRNSIRAIFGMAPSRLRGALVRRLSALHPHYKEALDKIDELDRLVKVVAETGEKHRRRLEAAQDQLRLHGNALPFVPNGHFYSPIAALEEVMGDAERIFSDPGRSINGIDLNEERQLQLLDKIEGYYQDLPFRPEKTDSHRYYYDNSAYSYSDAIFLNGMIRHARPNRIVEVGSGYSSCMTLDTNELWFENSIKCSFIEPYPDLLHSLLKEGDRERITIYSERLQDVDAAVFAELQANDILFIDSTHVGKVGSDVNHLFFNVLPALQSGVFIHFHDIFYPFEYPRPWIEEGRAWNELYMLRAFLMHNEDFKIVLFNTFLEKFHREYFSSKMPLCLKNPGGSIWIRRR